MLNAGTTPDIWTVAFLLLLPVAAMVAGFVLVLRYLRAQKERPPADAAGDPHERNRRERDGSRD